MIDILIFLGAFALIIWLSTLIAKYAENVAHHLGEPFGTMVLTLSAVAVEIVMIGIVMSDGNHPTLARDTIYSAIMVDVAGILGLSALIGGYRHIEQKFNFNSGQSYLMTMIAALVLTMVAPDYIPEFLLSKWMFFCSGLLILMYGSFLMMQTNRHSSYFRYISEESDHSPTSSLEMSAAVMILLLIGVGAMAEVMSHVLDHVSLMIGVSSGFAGALVAIASASPELIVAIKSALRNKIQPTLNIALGASLATVLLTAPLSIILGRLLNIDIELGLSSIQMAMMGSTLILAYMATQDGKTNMLEGSVLFSMFLGFVFHTIIA